MMSEESYFPEETSQYPSTTSIVDNGQDCDAAEAYYHHDYAAGAVMTSPEAPAPTAPPAPTTVQQLSEGERAFRLEQVRAAVIACQPQEGSLPNTLTKDGIEELLPLVESLQEGTIPSAASDFSSSWSHVGGAQDSSNVDKKLDILGPWPTTPEDKNEGTACDDTEIRLDWHDAPNFTAPSAAAAFRKLVREGRFTSPTNAQCPGYLQCNLVVLPAGKVAFDFLLFCQRNPKSCPLLEVCESGSPHPLALAPTADLRTDCPKYAIYRNGQLEKEVTDVKDYWPEDAVSFLIGCSFSYDGALLDAGIPLRSAELGRNVPMYKTNLKCRPAGNLHGTMVVSMKPIPAMQIAKHVEITIKYTHAHGGPVCVGGDPLQTLGIECLDKPDWGDSIDVRSDEIPVFHACGVTPQAVLMESRVPFAITHAAGHMFVTDMPAHMNVV